MFLIGPRLHWLPDGGLAAEQWARLPHAAAFIAATEAGAFEAASRRAHVAWTRGPNLDGVDYARGRAISLRFYIH